MSWLSKLKFWGKKKVAELSEYADITEMEANSDMARCAVSIAAEFDDETVSDATYTSGRALQPLNIFPPADKDDWGPKLCEEFIDQNELVRITEREFINLTTLSEKELEDSLDKASQTYLDNTTPEFREMAKRAGFGIAGTSREAAMLRSPHGLSTYEEAKRINRALTFDTVADGLRSHRLSTYEQLPIQSIADLATEIMNDRPNDDSDALSRVSGLWGETLLNYGADSRLSEVLGYRNHPRSQWWRDEIEPLLEAALRRHRDRQQALSDMRGTVHYLRELRKELLGDVGGILIYTHPDYVDPLSTIEEDFRKIGLIP